MIKKMDQFDSITKCFDNRKNNEVELECKCKHRDICTENDKIICNECGEELENILSCSKETRSFQSSDPRKSDPTRVHARKNEDKSIGKDLINLNISDTIATKANYIYEDVTNGKIYRGSSRKAIIFACVYHAYKISGIPQTADSLLRTFDISRKNGLKGMKVVNINASYDSEIHNSEITIVNIIQDILSNFVTSKHHELEVVDLYSKIHNRSSRLNRARPQSVAASVVYYWIKTKNLNVTLEEFARITELSQMTIVKNTKEVGNILL